MNKRYNNSWQSIFNKNVKKSNQFIHPRNRAERRQAKKQKATYPQVEKVKPKKEDLANQLNKSLNYAKNTHSRYEEYFKNLDPIIRELMGSGYIPKPGDENKYFKIDEEYNPKKNAELFKHIDFKSLPEDEEVKHWVENINNLHWSSEENLSAHKEEIAKQSYLSNIASAERLDYYVVDTLESLMNSSAAWRIASRDSLESEQTKEKWTELFKNVSSVYKADNKLFDKVYQMIMNEADYYTILEFIDNEMYKLLGE